MEGNADVDIEILPIKMAIRRHVKNRDAFTDIFNRVYETLMLCMGEIAALRADNQRLLYEIENPDLAAVAIALGGNLIVTDAEVELNQYPCVSGAEVKGDE